MKRDMEHLNLRDAFAPMPEEAHDALMSAARSVKEDEPVKKAAFRTVLIAACVIVATMAVAMAAGQIFGWNDFFKKAMVLISRKLLRKSWQRVNLFHGRKAMWFSPCGNVTVIPGWL
jgi:hypothetical protein